MFEVIWAAAAFIVAIGVLVSFHEFGHFWVARRLGVKVLRFSVGFGRPLWTRRGADGVEYVIAAVPLGGYVRMLDEREDAVAPGEVDQAFNRKNVWVRIAIVAAGPAFNFLLAFAFYWVIFVVGVPGMKPVIDEPPPGSRAAQAGLQEGMEVVRLDGKDIVTWQVLRAALLDVSLNRGRIELDVRDADGTLRIYEMNLAGVRVDPEFLFDDLGLWPFQPDIPPVLAEVLSGEPAAAAGFRAGDRLLSYGGVPLQSWKQWADWVRASPGEVVDVEFERNGMRQQATLIVGSEVRGDGTVQGRFGARVDVPDALWENLTIEHRLGIFPALSEAVAQTVRMSALTLKMLYRMVLGDVSVKNVAGPIQIAQYAGYTAGIGLVSFLGFLAIVSVSLGVLNLLPVPVLDGGHLLYYLVEVVKGSPLSDQAQAFGQRVGISLLIALMGLAFYNDILRLIG
jgi:regulator of sigma E protease